MIGDCAQAIDAVNAHHCLQHSTYTLQHPCGLINLGKRTAKAVPTQILVSMNSQKELVLFTQWP
jgi:hypothetical protein